VSSIVTIIRTLDEELHIGRCVRSAVPLGAVFVVDCGSTDRTVEIAREAGATVAFHPWEGYVGQWNWAIDHVPVDATWLLFLGADEFLTHALRDELKRAASRPEVDGYLLTSENIFLGRTLKRAYWHPRLVRMYRRGRGRWEERSVHEYAMVDGRVDVIRNVLPHENLKGIDAFLERHVHYARLEAGEMDQAAARGTGRIRISDLLGGPATRRRALKTKVWYRLPARPAIRFVWNFLIRGGFMDGRQGLVYTQLIAAYEAMIDAKRLESRLGSAGRPVLDAAATDIRALLVCPTCRGDLTWRRTRARCADCNLSYPVIDGIPVLVGATNLRDIHQDEIDHNVEQATHFDRPRSEEFETVRPRGTPRWHRFLLSRKLHFGMAPYRTALPNSTVLCVCGGSGMDAELVTRAGATVISADISIGAARRAAERARRFNLPIFPIVADAENLPFRDMSVDTVTVHDGLHHLADPLSGLDEMCRVAKTFVSISEPARAAVTSLAIRSGIALDREPAGNRVMRFGIAELVDGLGQNDFEVVSARRYAMFYRHEPGTPSVLLSLPFVYSLAKATWRVANWAFGSLGNKLVVVAMRRRPE
jgi:SAM-dependent methyltransferase/glycosyltransferase involved in cell wall biosynthesis